MLSTIKSCTAPALSMAADGAHDDVAADADALSREVYCILGIPIDAIEMPAVLDRIRAAAARAAPFLISTPNLNFLVNSQFDPEFRESLLRSDLCPADGMPIVWVARLMGVPIKTRIAGSDIFDALNASQCSARRLKVFLFGGPEGVAAAACRALNVNSGGLSCVGSIYPGFGTVEAMSHDDTIEKINASNADLLVASLGARKGQLWLLHNHRRLRTPIRVHLGAVMNFAAGTVKRAPLGLRKVGLEWLWRIKEEPHLWRRYWHDGGVLLRLVISHLIPLTTWAAWLRLTGRPERQDLVVTQKHDEHASLALSGAAVARHVEKAISCFRDALITKKPIILDWSGTNLIDARFLGLVLVLRRRLKADGLTLKFVGVSPRLARMFRLNGVGYLLSHDQGM